MLNNKGVTTIEVLICFVLVTIISTSLFSTVSMFNDKRIEENNKSKIIIYSNTLTRIIQKDFITYGIKSATINETNENGLKTITVTCNLKSGEQRILRIKQKFTRSSIHPECSNEIYIDDTTRYCEQDNYDDEFMIEYGSPDKIIKYPIPELGEVIGKYDDNLKTFVPCTKDQITVSNELRKKDSLTDSENKQICRVLKDLEINNLLINISNEASSDDIESRVLNIYIGFYHPELGNRYAINIVSPIDYPVMPSSKNGTFNFNLITE